jgi:hypothetical protein
MVSGTTKAALAAIGANNQLVAYKGLQKLFHEDVLKNLISYRSTGLLVMSKDPTL